MTQWQQPEVSEANQWPKLTVSPRLHTTLLCVCSVGLFDGTASRGEIRNAAFPSQSAIAILVLFQFIPEPAQHLKQHILSVITQSKGGNVFS